MSKKLIITVGCSGSGKSTWAHKQWLKYPNTTIVINRDKIRELLFGYTESDIFNYYRRKDLDKLEKQVTKYEDTLINEGLCENKTVIVDATHLKEKHIKRFEYWNVPIKLVQFDISLTDAILRNKTRVRKVNNEIISKQFNNYQKLRKFIETYSFNPVTLNNEFVKPVCWIFDIDGTLSHNNSRSPYDESKVLEDTPDDSCQTLFQTISCINVDNMVEQLYFCSGRTEKCRKDTEKWLNYYIGDTRRYTLFMRKEGDSRPDYIVKKEMYEEIVKTNYIAGIFDDRLQVVRYVRSLGLKVLNVEYNNF